MQFTDVIDRRRSIRAYSAKVVPKSKLDAVLATVQRAPSAGDLQAYLVITVESPETKALLAEAALGQSFIAEAPVVFVFLADTCRSESKYGKRGAALFSLQDATIAAAYAQLAATAEGLGSCWVGAFDEARVARAIGAPARFRAVALLPIGYPAEAPALTPRRSLSELVRSERC
jgi:nitroreductase